MKRIFILSIIAFLFVWGGNGSSAYAQLSPNGTWVKTTISDNVTVNLTGDVTIAGTITIDKGATLTINGNGQTITPYTLVNPKDANDKNIQGPVSFQVLGKLVMAGSSSANPIVIDGGNGQKGQITVGNNYKGGGENAIEAGKDFTKAGIVINVVDDAEVELDYIKAVNLYVNEYLEVGSLINVKTHSDDNKNRSKVSMDYVEVDNCYNNNGAGVILSAGQTVKNDIVMTNCKITNCMSKANMTGTNYGGVIKGSGNTDCCLTMNNCTMSYCWGSGWGGAILWASNIGGCKAVLNNCTFNNNYARYLGGALSTEAVMELTGCVISGNTAGFGGGGIAAFPFTLTDASTGTQAVGLVLHTENKITQNKTLWATNKNADTTSEAPLYNALYTVDGQLQSMGGDKQKDYGFNPRYTIANATDVYYPSGGGGIWVLMNKDLWSCEIEIGEDNTISGNYSAYDGGGVFLYKQRPYTSTSAADVTFIPDYNYSYVNDDDATVSVPNSGLTSMTLHSNITGNKSARSGGGAAVGSDVGSDVTEIAETWTFPNVTVTGGDISNNMALNGNGGGIYMPGGIFTISDGTITNNQAQINEKLDFEADGSEEIGNGGGISIANGTFTITKPDFVISGNKASRFGGGLFVNKAKDNVTFSGGTFQENLARAGGGMAFEGEANSQYRLFMKASLINNQAINGGGIYLNNYAKMVFQGGMIRKNLASVTIPSNGFEYTTLPEKTAYHKHVNEVNGVGGGIFMDDNTSLTFAIEGKNLGLYNNRATAAADDIFANGNNTTITIPDVSKMNLDSYEGAAGELFWAEDYYAYYDGKDYEHDAEYDEGSKQLSLEQGAQPKGNLRYHFALAHMRKDYIAEVPAASYTNYVCLVLGYQIFYVNIIKKGLKAGESAVFNIYKMTEKDKVISETDTPYLSTLLTGTDDTGSMVYRTIALPTGYWGVKENNWGYMYNITSRNPENGIRHITTDDDIMSEDGFKFENTPKDDKDKLLHHEFNKTNIMGIKQENNNGNEE